MEDNFDTYLIQVARNCGTNYICVFGGGNCGASFRIEDEIVQHLRSAHEPEFLNRYNLLNGILAAARPPTTSYNVEESIGLAISGEVEESIGRAISEEVASNSEGEGDDPLCISSAEKRKAIDMELMCPTCKRSRYHKNVVEESTAVAYDMKEHVPMKEKKDVLMLRKEEELGEYAFNRQRKKEELEKYALDMLSEKRWLEEYAFNMLRKSMVASKICAGNSEGEGDDPLCISSTEKGKARDMKPKPEVPLFFWDLPHNILEYEFKDEALWT